MPIVNQVVTSTPQADGSSNVTVVLYDQDAKPYSNQFNAPPGFDIAAKVALMIAELNEQFAADEFNALVGL